MVGVILETEDLITFRSIRPYAFQKRVLGYYLPCPFNISSITDLDYLLGRKILIDDCPYQCHSIELKAESLPMKKGEEIAVWVGRLEKK